MSEIPALQRWEELDKLGPEALAKALPSGTMFIDVVCYTHFEYVNRQRKRTPSYVPFVVHEKAPSPPTPRPRSGGEGHVVRIELEDAVPIDAVVMRWREALLEPRNGHGKDYRLYVSRGKAYKATLASDGYATGFAVFVTRQGGLVASDERLQKGSQWLRKNQRETGRWFKPSIGPPHSRHLISHAGTACALMALDACGMIATGKTP